MKAKKLFATMAISTMLLTGCSFHQNDAIVKVNGQAITQGQFDKLFDKAASNSMFAQMGMDIKNDKKGFLYLMIKDKVVNELIVKALLEQEMAKRKIEVSKEDTDRELRLIMDKVGSKEKFNEILKQNGISSSQFKKDLAEEVKMKKLVRMISKVEITQADAKKFYKQNVSKFKYPDKVRASHILIAANPEELKEKFASDPANKSMSQEEIQKMVDNEMAKKLEIAKSVLAEVKKDPTSFDRVARSKSEDPTTAKKGGDLGFFSKQEMVEPFSKAAFELKPNVISDLVQTPYGYHIILVKDRMQAGLEPYEKVESEIILYLENQENVKVLEKLIESLKKQAKIEYVNPEFNPTSIQDALKQEAKNNPTANEELNPQNHSATPAPAKK